MILKFMTAFNQGVASIDQFRLIDEVESIHVTDIWLNDKQHIAGQSAWENVQKSEGLQGYAPPQLYVPHYLGGVKCSENYSQMQVFVIDAVKKNGEIDTYISLMPVFVMNDNGKTVESLYPSQFAA